MLVDVCINPMHLHVAHVPWGVLVFLRWFTVVEITATASNIPKTVHTPNYSPRLQANDTINELLNWNLNHHECLNVKTMVRD